MLLQSKGDIQPAPSEGPSPAVEGWRASSHSQINYISVTSTAIPASILRQKLGPCPCPGAGSGDGWSTGCSAPVQTEPLNAKA